MDFIRTPYRFTMRVSADPEVPPQKGYWYFTDLPFLPFPTAFNSSFFRENHYEEIVLGEAFQPHPPFAGQKVIRGLKGDHICGTEEQFLNGLPEGYIGPPVPVDPDGIPLCCGREGVVWVESGTRPASELEMFVRRPANVRSGSRPASVVEHIPGTPPQVRTGTKAESIVEHYFSPRLKVMAGARALSRTSLIAHERGRVMAGARPASVVTTDTVIRGRAMDGAAVASVVTLTGHAPALVESGARPAATVSQLSAVSGLVEGGARPASVVVQSETIKGMVPSGAVVSSIVEQIEPSGLGTTCATATLLAPVVHHDFTADASTSYEGWAYFVSPPSGTWAVFWSPEEDGILFGEILGVGGCSSQHVWRDGYEQMAHAIIGNGTDIWMVRVRNEGGTAVNFSIWLQFFG